MRARGKKRRRGRRGVTVNYIRHDRLHLIVLLCGICVVLCYGAIVLGGITKIAWVLGCTKHSVRNEKVMIPPNVSTHKYVSVDGDVDV